MRQIVTTKIHGMVTIEVRIKNQRNICHEIKELLKNDKLQIHVHC